MYENDNDNVEDTETKCNFSYFWIAAGWLSHKVNDKWLTTIKLLCYVFLSFLSCVRVNWSSHVCVRIAKSNDTKNEVQNDEWQRLLLPLHLLLVSEMVALHIFSYTFPFSSKGFDGVCVVGWLRMLLLNALLPKRTQNVIIINVIKLIVLSRGEKERESEVNEWRRCSVGGNEALKHNVALGILCHVLCNHFRQTEPAAQYPATQFIKFIYPFISSCDHF